MSDGVTPAERPERYEVPEWGQVKDLLEQLRRQRQGAHKRIWKTRRARRSQWTEVVAQIPAAYRKMLGDIDQPMVRDMLQRVVGIIAAHAPTPEVTPPTIRPTDVKTAAAEEANLHAMRITIEDQQRKPIYQLGIDSQCANGESWILVYPDLSRLEYSEKDGAKGYRRGKDEKAGEYSKRYRDLMLRQGVPVSMCDYDPLCVFPLKSGEATHAVIIETEHEMHDVELGLGYRPVRGEDKKTTAWAKGDFTLGAPQVPGHTNMGGPEAPSSGDTTHITQRERQNEGASNRYAGASVKKVQYLDPFVYLCFLDGIEVERWEHNWGVVPCFPAGGQLNSDRDPEFESEGIADVAISIVRQVVFFSAVAASSALQHGFPTPFIENPAMGLVHPRTNEPLIRPIEMGRMNVLGPGEKIVFPFLEGRLNQDFMNHLNYLLEQMETYGLSNFGKSLGSDMAGYAIAQIRAMQMSKLSTIYTELERQWREIFYFFRHLVNTCVPGGLYMRGTIATDDESGLEYRPVLEYSKDTTTDFAIEVRISQGIPQDEIAERKSALELMQNGVWSKRRVMEETGVEDPSQEGDEIAVERLTGSPAFDQQTLMLAFLMGSQRFTATQQQQSSPFFQFLEEAKARVLGGPGQFANQEASPANASPDGTPLNQQPPAPSFDNLGVPAQQPGGSQGVTGGGTPAAVGTT